MGDFDLDSCGDDLREGRDAEGFVPCFDQGGYRSL
jgi:hypothetical protein